MEASESPLPPRIQEALGELVGAAREGLLALSVGVEHELLELEVDEVVGPKGKHDPARTGKRHGHRYDDRRHPPHMFAGFGEHLLARKLPTSASE